MKAKFIYTGIRVKDLDKSVEFYTKVMGMKEVGRSEIKEVNGKLSNLVSEDNAHSLELNYYEEGTIHDVPYSVGEGIDHLAFQVDSIDEALKEANKAGYPTILDVKTKSSRWAYIADPDGIWIELVQ